MQIKFAHNPVRAQNPSPAVGEDIILPMVAKRPFAFSLGEGGPLAVDEVLLHFRTQSRLSVTSPFAVIPSARSET